MTLTLECVYSPAFPQSVAQREALQHHPIEPLYATLGLCGDSLIALSRGFSTRYSLSRTASYLGTELASW